MTSPTNVRFPAQVDQSLSAFAHRTGSKKSTVVVAAVAEWLRTQAHPRIRFVTTNTGERRAALWGGPQVWTVAEAWQQNDPDERTSTTLSHVTGLSVPDVEAALTYYAEFRVEIDELIDRLHAEADRALAAWERRQALDAR